MKIQELFKNRKSIYLYAVLIIVLILAGGIWQYNNYLDIKMSKLDLENQYKEMNDIFDKQDVADTKIVDQKIHEGGAEDKIQEVSNTDRDTKKPTKPSEVKGPTAKNDAAEKAVEVNNTEVVNINTMIIPVFGNITKNFSDTELIYSKTLDSYVTHSGIDIKADLGSQVRAALDGKVIAVDEDPLWGNTIILDHGNGILTKYSNLSTLSLVKEGQTVKKGSVISGVGNNANQEISDEPHLHFELIRDNKCVNPRDYLPKKAN